jgi:type II secretory pathway component PulJ
VSRYRTGASVMELLVALGLLFLVGFILLGSLSTNRSSLQQDRRLHEASQTVRTLMERQVDLAETGTGYSNLASIPLSFATADQVYRVDVSAVSATLKRVDVSLWWAQSGATAPTIDSKRPIIWKLTSWVGQP